MNVILYQYSETNVMHFLFSLLRIKGLYTFRTLLTRPQEVLHKRHLLFCVRVMSVGCFQGWNVIEFHSNPGSSQLTQHALNIPSAACVASPEDEQVMLETCRGLDS
jgi:hypothetical protein